MTANSTTLQSSKSHQFLSHAKLVDRLLRSGFFQSYQEVFEASTGLSLELQIIGSEEIELCRGSVNQNQFCRMLNRGDSGCRQCLVARRSLSKRDGRGVRSLTCFAGLQETVLPVSFGGSVIAQLKTGQIVHENPSIDTFRKVSLEFRDDMEVKTSELEEAYMATPVIGKQQYQAMLTLLAAFSLQLTKVANQIGREQEDENEDVIGLAREYIGKNIAEPLGLNQVAKEMEMSPSHFCRRFKRGVGVTLTEFITEHRVEVARELLLKTERRITDIAFDSGFQSLSQFNRSFRRMTGMSPTKFRNRATS